MSELLGWSSLVLSIASLISAIGVFAKTMAELRRIRSIVNGNSTAQKQETAELRSLVNDSVRKGTPVTVEAAENVLPAQTKKPE